MIISNLRIAFCRLRNDIPFLALTSFVLTTSLAASLFLIAQIYAINYRALPFTNGEKIVVVAREENGSSRPFGGILDFDTDYFSIAQTTLENFGSFSLRSVSLAASDFTDSATSVEVSESFFRISDGRPILGRVFVSSDFIVGAPKVAVIGYDIWVARFAKDKEIINRAILVDGVPATIVGVMPIDYRFPYREQLWVPYISNAPAAPDGVGWRTLFGSLKSGVSVDKAKSEFVSLANELAQKYPKEYSGKSVVVRTFVDAWSADLKALSLIMTVVALSIAIIGCASFSNLMTVRILEQGKEMLVKSTIGLPSRKILALPLIESLLIIVPATVAGIAVCYSLIKYASSFALSSSGPFWWELKMDFIIWVSCIVYLTILWFLILIICLKTLNQRSLASTLSSGRKNAASGGLIDIFLIGFQCFFVFILIVFVGLCTSAFLKTVTANYGVNPENYFTADVNLPEHTYPTLKDRNAYFQKFADLLHHSNNPSIKKVTFTGALPGESSYVSSYSGVDADYRNIDGSTPKVREIPISSNYFDTLGVEIIEGRAFLETDDEDSQQVLIINKKLAETLWPNQSAIGRKLQLNPEVNGQLLTIVGVVPNMLHGEPISLGPKNYDLFYRPMFQVMHAWAGMEILIKVESDRDKSVPLLISRIAREADSMVPLSDISSYKERLKTNGEEFKTLSINFIPSAVIALLIAFISIYGVSARMVSNRSAEIGILMSIGWQDRLIGNSYLVIIGKKVVFGLLFAVAVSFFMLPLFSEKIALTDITTYILIAFISSVVITLIVLIATLLPLKRILNQFPHDVINL